MNLFSAIDKLRGDIRDGDGWNFWHLQNKTGGQVSLHALRDRAREGK